MNQFPNGLSPDGIVKADQVYWRGTTSSNVGLISTKNGKTLFVIDAYPGLKYTTLLWSPTGSYLSIHDSSKIHSRLRVIARNETTFHEITVPDLKARVIESYSINEKELKSSGQLPIKWINDSSLKVLVRLKMKDSSIKNVIIHIKILNDQISIDKLQNG